MAVEKTLAPLAWKSLRDSHFPTASATTVSLSPVRSKGRTSYDEVRGKWGRITESGYDNLAKLTQWNGPIPVLAASELLISSVAGEGGTSMAITTVALDIAKHFFQVHGVDEQGNVFAARTLRRD